MNDEQIVQLYWDRSEQAIAESQSKYGAYCHAIAFGVLKNQEDSEEVVSDTWLRTWNAIPPQRPKSLQAFLAKITRNLSLDRIRMKQAKRRGGDAAGYELAVEELAECIASSESVESAVEGKELGGILNRFLEGLDDEARRVFLQRYWYLLDVREIAERQGFSESKVKMLLHRTRKRLREYLDKEGYGI